MSAFLRESATTRPAHSQSSGFLRWMSMSIFCGAILLGTARRSAASTLMVTDNGNALPGSLRTQIAAANSGDTIDCTPIAGNTVALLSPLTINNKSLTITSTTTPVIVDGAGLNQVLNIHQGPANTVVLNNLTLQNGKLQGANGNNAGAGAATAGTPAQGGGIYCSGGALTLTQCTISGNKVIGGNGGSGNAAFPNGAVGGAARGGGIFCTGTVLTLTTCTLSSNSVLSGNAGSGATAAGGTGGNGGYFTGAADGGGVFTDTAPVISGTMFQSNKAQGGVGGAGANATGTAGAHGGFGSGGGYARGAGIFLSLGASSTTTIANSTFSGNSALGGAAGLSGSGGNNAAGNGGYGGCSRRAGTAYGGGIYSKNGALYLSSTSLTGNMSTGGLGGSGGSGGNAGGNGVGGAAGPTGYYGPSGGHAKGGGIFVVAGLLSCTASSLNLNSCSGGAGGPSGLGGTGSGLQKGGMGGAGGNGGHARGGGIYSFAPLVFSGGSIANNSLAGGNGYDGAAGGVGGANGAGGFGGKSGAGGSANGAGVYVANNASASISGATITTNSGIGGFSGNGGAGGDGGGGNNTGGHGGYNRRGGTAMGGGLLVRGSLTLSSSTVSLNTTAGGAAGNAGAGGNGAGSVQGGSGGLASYPGGYATGAGMWIYGTATLTGSTVSQNTATGGSGGRGGRGGGGPIPGPSASGATGGFAGGAGITALLTSASSINYCTISSNQVKGGDGGPGADARAGTGLNGGNGGSGANAYGGGIFASGTLSLTNGTNLAGNSVIGGDGASGGAGGSNMAGLSGAGGNGGAGGISRGGAICTRSGTRNIAGVTVSGNSNIGGSGAVGGPGGYGGTTGNGGSGGSGGSAGLASGGGIADFGVTAISTSTIVSNSNAAGIGGNGGIGGDGVIGGNGGNAGACSATGGGIDVESTGTMTVIASTIAANTNLGSASGVGGNGGNGTTSGGNGGGGSLSVIAGGGISNYGAFTVINSTISGNSNSPAAGAAGGAGGNGPATSGSGGSGNSTNVKGGGIAINSSSTTQINNSTISSNICSNAIGGAGGTAGVGPAGSPGVPGNFYAGNGGGVRAQGIGVVTLSSSIVAKNTASGAADLSGTLSAASDHNLIGDGTQTLGISNGANGNQIGTSATPIDPKLGPLQNNGGPTQTRLLSFGSPAVGAGSNLLSLTTEQRGAGFPRLLGPKPDVGATAFDSFPPTATLSAPDVTSASASYFFTVTFADAFGVDVTGAGTGNILVTGPNGFSQIATFVSVTPAVSGPSLTVTYMITPPNGVWAYAANGAYTVAIQASQINDLTGNFMPAGSLGAFNVNIFAAPPVFISAPTATPDPALVNQSLQFASQISGTLPLTIGWNFGDGLSGSGSSLVHAFSAPGTYTVTVTVVDGNGLSTQTTFLVVVIDANGDADGDGISNDVELLLGSDPLSAASTPFDINKPTSSAALKVKKLGIQLNFGAESSDTIKLSGELPLSNFKTLSQSIIFNIGQVIKAFQLGARGKGAGSIGPTGRLNDSVRMSKRGAFSVTLPHGAFQAALDSDPDPARELTNSQGNSKTRTVKVTVYFNATVFTADATAPYSAIKGKFGK